MRMTTYAGFALVACNCSAAFGAQLEPAEVNRLPHAQVEARLPDAHPSIYLLYASRLWFEGRNEPAVFWLYVGQLRFRFHLAANPNMPPGSDAALFGALQANLAEPINLYAGGDIDRWMAQIDKALAWDETTPNGFTSKTTHAAAWQTVRAGLVKLRDQIDRDRATLMARREAEGIGRVGIFEGVYLEERKAKMPKDWPALPPETSLAALAGTYEATFQSVLAPTFFFAGNSPARRSKTIVLVPLPPDRLEAVAISDGKELGRRTVEVGPVDGMIAFTDTHPADTAGLAEGTNEITTRLALNSAGELVIARHVTVAGRKSPLATPIRRESIYWSRARPAAMNPPAKP